MSVLEFILRVVALVVLGTYLYLLHRRQRQVMNAQRPREDASVWSGHPIDVETLRVHLAEVRRDYTKISHRTRSRPTIGNDRLRRSRRAVLRRAYFQRRDPDHDSQGETVGLSDQGASPQGKR